jgi:hypothetical protein
MADLIKLVLTMPRTNAAGAVIATNVLPGGPAEGQGATAEDARTALGSVLSARAASAGTDAAVLQSVADQVAGL